MLKWIRKNIGAISAAIGFFILVMLTFGDIANILMEEYWRNVAENIAGISALSIGLTLVQYTIKQGISEQALSIGLNTENTKKKYNEHNELVKSNTNKSVFLPYFLDEYNRRETKRRRQEFLVNNNFSTEARLIASGNKKLIKAYNKIYTCIDAASIKWSSTEIVYKKNGKIEQLHEYRIRRARTGIIKALIMFLGTSLVTTGIIAENLQTSLMDKCIQLLVYVLVIAASVIFDVGKNYEKGAFGVPNELDIINGIWQEFENWTVPQWVIEDIEKDSRVENDIDIKDVELESDIEAEKEEVYDEETTDTAAAIQEEPKKEQDVQDISTD